MKILKIIKDEDIGSTGPSPETFKKRIAGRAVVFDKQNNIALLQSAKFNFPKLPGGGVEEDENIEETLTREMREEIGCEIKNIQELGIIEEYRNTTSVHQLSYYFLAELDGEKGSPNFTEKETAENFKIIWLSLDKAIEIIDSGHAEHYDSKFIRLRDLTLLKEVKSLGLIE